MMEVVWPFERLVTMDTLSTSADFLDLVVTELIWVFGHADSEAAAGTPHHYSRDASCHDQHTAGFLCLPAWS